MRPFRLAVAAVALTLAAPHARAQDGKPDPAAADTKIASAKAHYAKAEMGAALADLAEAYHLDPRPDLLYAMAQIEVELGDCAGAVAHYKQYIATGPSPKGKEAAEKAKAACEAKLGITETTPVTTTTTIEPVKPKPPEPIKKAPELEVVHRPFYKDGLGDTLAIGGVVAGAAGGVLYLMARKDIDDSETAATLQDHLDLVDKAHSLRTDAVIAASVGGALVVGAIIRWASHGGGTETRERVDVSLAPTADGGWTVAAFGRF